VDLAPGSHSRAALPRDRRISDGAADELRRSGIVIGKGRRTSSPPAADPNAAIQLTWDVRHAFFSPPNPLLALKRSLRLVESEPDNFGAILTRQFVLYASGNPKSAAEMSRRMFERYPDRHEGLHWGAHIAQAMGRATEAEALLRAANSIEPQEGEISYDLACARAVAGDRDAAFEWLNKAIDSGYRQWSHIEEDADLATLRTDRRYSELMRKHGR
jgi:predicted Zn-dependent protease